MEQYVHRSLLLRKFFTLYGTCTFIAMCTGAHHLSLSPSIYIIFSSGLFPWGFSTKCRVCKCKIACGTFVGCRINLFMWCNLLRSDMQTDTLFSKQSSWVHMGIFQGWQRSARFSPVLVLITIFPHLPKKSYMFWSNLWTRQYVKKTGNVTCQCRKFEFVNFVWFSRSLLFSWAKPVGGRLSWIRLEIML